jgi:flavin reductase (DIM6/NTAB) family NADH-FMN oxidoreductase RutF
MVNTDYCGIVSGSKADKSEVFRTFTGETGAPMVETCGLNVECRLHHIDANGMNETFVGDIVGIYADDAVLTGGKVDFAKLDPLILSQLDTRYYALGAEAGKAWSVGRGQQ